MLERSPPDLYAAADTFTINQDASYTYEHNGRLAQRLLNRHEFQPRNDRPRLERKKFVAALMAASGLLASAGIGFVEVDQPPANTYEAEAHIHMAEAPGVNPLPFAGLMEISTPEVTIPPVTLPEVLPTTTTVVPKPAVETQLDPGSIEHQAWMAEAGIDKANFGYVNYIVEHESPGWVVDKVSPNGCIGLGQNCPDKNGHYWLKDACPDWQTNAPCQLRRFQIYAFDRYKNWLRAYQHKIRYRWW